MKYYIGLALLVAGLLLLIPLITVPAAQTALAPPAPEPSGSEAPPEPTSEIQPLQKPQAEEDIFLIRHQEGETVSAAPVRDFLIYTLAAEMLPSFHEEALKAQVVAAYTYFSYQKAQERKAPTPELNGADFADTPVAFPDGYNADYWKAKWGEKAYETYYPKLCAAVDAVYGKKMTYEGQAIFAAYHAMSSGTTEDAQAVWASAFPYLQPVESPGDRLSPKYETQVVFSPPELSEKLKDKEGIELTGDGSGWITGEISKTASKTVLAITIGGVNFSGRELRDLLGLRSACFDVAFKEGAFVFTVYGYGHGVGLSQYGADHLAGQGYTYEEILTYYYTGVTIEG